jgi:hypothetical protein
LMAILMILILSLPLITFCDLEMSGTNSAWALLFVSEIS